MNCAFSRDLLALHVENDLPVKDERIVANHLLECGECSRFLELLDKRQSQLKLLRRDAIHPAAFVNMRRDVLDQIRNSPRTLGWPVRIERMMFLGFRRHAVVFTCLAIAAVVSATLFAQMRQMEPQPAAMAAKPVAVFAGSDILVRPVGYRDWISADSSIVQKEAVGHHISRNGSSGFSRSVYIDRSAYREFSDSGKVPEGAVLILETFRIADKQPIALEASVKDYRFEGGWGYFDFTAEDGTIKGSAPSILENGTCRSCHEKNAKFDRIFTQIHSALKTAT